jgi:hypothetical protein
MDDPNSPAEQYESSLDVHRAMHRVMLYAVLPLWIVPGFADYLFHRKSNIERTSGTHESLIHALQMTTIGVPTFMALVFEINVPVIATMIAGALAHEVLTLWDIAYAEPLRRPTPNEQHAHSFLEVLPLMALTSTLTLHPSQTAALFGRGDAPATWRFRLKQPPLSRLYLGAIFAAITVFLVLPYAEEFVRCYRSDGTFAPHQPPDDPAVEADRTDAAPRT